MTVASTTSLIASLLFNGNAIVFYVLGGLLLTGVGLLGLGMAWRWVTRHITGSGIVAWTDHMIKRPYKGARRGYYYRLPWNRGKFGNDV